MPTYEIEQYELWSSKFRVQAANRGEAIAKLLCEGGEAVDDSSQLIEVCDDRGMLQVEHADLVAELEAAGCELSDDAIIPSIRDVEEAQDDEDELDDGDDDA